MRTRPSGEEEITRLLKERVKFYEAFLELKTIDEVREFLNDLLTPGEIEIFVDRWWIARLIEAEKMAPKAIIDLVKASSGTVTRVSNTFKSGGQGYRRVIARINGHE